MIKKNPPPPSLLNPDLYISGSDEVTWLMCLQLQSAMSEASCMSAGRGKRLNFEFCRQKETFRYPTPACAGACICFVSAENAVHKSFLHYLSNNNKTHKSIQKSKSSKPSIARMGGVWEDPFRFQIRACDL